MTTGVHTKKKHKTEKKRGIERNHNKPPTDIPIQGENRKKTRTIAPNGLSRCGRMFPRKGRGWGGRGTKGYLQRVGEKVKSKLQGSWDGNRRGPEEGEWTKDSGSKRIEGYMGRQDGDGAYEGRNWGSTKTS